MYSWFEAKIFYFLLVPISSIDNGIWKIIYIAFDRLLILEKYYRCFETVEFKTGGICICIVWQWKIRIHFQLQNYSYSNCVWFINIGKILLSMLHLLIDKKSIKDFHHFEFVFPFDNERSNSFSIAKLFIFQLYLIY